MTASSARLQRLEALERSSRVEIERESVLTDIADCDRTLALLREQLALIASVKAAWVEQKRDELRRQQLLVDAEAKQRLRYIEEQTVELERILYDSFLPGLRRLHQQQRRR